MRTEGWANNGDVRIHFIEINREAPFGSPLVVVPGMINSADEYCDEFEGLLSRHTIFISLRGRGKSDAPERGYSFNDQLGDIEAVIDQLTPPPFHLLGYSVGVPFALGYIEERPDHVRSLILCDYPPVYPRFPESWIDNVLAIPSNTMKESAVRGIVAEGEERVVANVLPSITVPVLVIRGESDESLLPEESAAGYSHFMPGCRIEVLEGRGHDFFDPDAERFAGLIEDFMKSAEG